MRSGELFLRFLTTVLFSFNCVVVFGKICSEEIIIEKAGILPVVPEALGIIFYLTIFNSGFNLLDTAVKMTECCESVNDEERDCSHIELSGGYMGRLKPQDKKNLTLMYHNLYPYNRKGDCVVAVWCRSEEGGFNELKTRIEFDTMLSQISVPPLLHGYYTPSEVTKCKSFDEDPLDKCNPVDCARKYNGKRVFFSKRYNRCVPAPVCTSTPDKPLPDVAYVPEANVCADLEHPLGAAEVKFFAQGTKCYDSLDPNPGGFQICHHGYLDRAKGRCVCHPGWKSARQYTVRPTSLPVHLCTLPLTADPDNVVSSEVKESRQPPTSNPFTDSWWTDEPNALPYVFETWMAVFAICILINALCAVCNVMSFKGDCKEPEPEPEPEPEEEECQIQPEPCKKHTKSKRRKKLKKSTRNKPCRYEPIPMSSYSSTSTSSLSPSEESTDLTSSHGTSGSSGASKILSDTSLCDEELSQDCKLSEEEEQEEECEIEEEEEEEWVVVEEEEEKEGEETNSSVCSFTGSLTTSSDKHAGGDRKKTKTVRFKVDTSKIKCCEDGKTFLFSDVDIMFASAAAQGEPKLKGKPVVRWGGGSGCCQIKKEKVTHPKDVAGPSKSSVAYHRRGVVSKESHFDDDDYHCDGMTESIAELTTCTLSTDISPVEISDNDYCAACRNLKLKRKKISDTDSTV